VALLAGWIEYLIEYFAFPSIKSLVDYFPFVFLLYVSNVFVLFPPSHKQSWLAIFGILMTAVGQCIRTSAMWTAGSSFTHLIAREKKKSHVLISTGLYRFEFFFCFLIVVLFFYLMVVRSLPAFRYMRHPGYLGWYIWSIGTQLVICNPFCAIAYAFVAWKFFSTRIV
jgi:protein-S-isoprenylcysteine O-methyltransferase